MRVLVLSANTGEGHNSSGRAIMEVLQARGVECDLQDALSFLSPAFSRFICDWHLRIYQYGGTMFDKGYRLMENISSSQDAGMIYEFLGLGAGHLRDLVLENDYDAVVCSHVFAGLMLTEARKSWNLEIPSFYIATDYTCHPLVEECGMDTFFVPAPDIAQEFDLAGIPKSKQLVTGIPVRQVFFQPSQRDKSRALLGIPKDSVAVLVMCGSLGFGPIQQIALGTLEHMPEDSIMIVVCGKNEKLKEELSLLNDPRLRVLGYTNNIYDYMDAVDLVITKPGGLSAAEAANKHLPMVFINSVGGCESRNFELFLRNGYAVGYSTPEETIRVAIRMVWDGNARQKMRQTLERDFAVNSGALIADHIMAAGEKYRKAISPSN